MNSLEQRIFEVKTEKEFEKISLEIFQYQAQYNPIYKKFVEYLKVKPQSVENIEQIPFLPIEFFKTEKIVTQYYELDKKDFTIFQSSGTTGVNRSTHYIYNINLYKKSFLSGFEQFFGNPNQYTILALLPSYLETGNSSLVYMVNELVKQSQKKGSGFYLYEHDELFKIMKQLDDKNEKAILFGVSYALLDFAEYIKKHHFQNLIIIETGGMKGRKKEITRLELHSRIKNSFLGAKVCSEYGMTEMLSQAYSLDKEGKFKESKTLKILIRDINDPKAFLSNNRVGGINIIDISNLYSCSFLSTQDLGKKDFHGFEVLGRFDNSEIRGCNLLII